MKRIFRAFAAPLLIYDFNVIFYVILCSDDVVLEASKQLYTFYTYICAFQHCLSFFKENHSNIFFWMNTK